MATHTNQVVCSFDFSDALRHSPEERMTRCAERVRQRLIQMGIWEMFGVPPVPEVGASATEIRCLESDLRVRLPAEYRTFLQSWRYLVIHDGLTVWGFDHDGISIGRPWVSAKHRPRVPYLVFVNYWQFADGDQLMFDLSEAGQGVVVYLHEHGPLYEAFAPTFSLALWRMVEEWETEEE